MDTEAERDTGCAHDSDGDYEGAFTVELQGEIWSLMGHFMKYGSDIYEAGAEAFYAVAGRGLEMSQEQVEDLF